MDAMKERRVVEVDWRRMARISAAYCLFWERGDSSFAVLLRSQVRRLGEVPIWEAIVGWEERFSRTPGYSEQGENTWGLGLRTQYVVDSVSVGFIRFV